MECNGKKITRVYMVGIGGIGMSALAQLLNDKGVIVTGSDREESPVTELLEGKGITVLIGQKAENVPDDADIVIYTEAVWEDNPERVRAKELGIPQHSYFHMLGVVSEGLKTIAVAGTHGKTTTTGMLAKILSDAEVSPSAIVGSIVRDFGSNYLPGSSDWFVVEACEYKRDFMTLSPHILVVTNIEFDHSDYYRDLADVQSAFRDLMEKVPANGAIITDTESLTIKPLLEGLQAQIIDYTREPAYEPKLPGTFNVLNAKAAAAASRAAVPHITEDMSRVSIREFLGTWRRFEYKGKMANGTDVYDDYAHHPTAVRSTLEALRARTSGRVLVAFHPHLFSRTRDLFDDFGRAFACADEVIIAPIYPAREIDDGTVSHHLLAKRIQEEGVNARGLDSFEEIEQALRTTAAPGDVVITMGAGDIYKVADRLVA
jgi:UDP-N-acetylmuramate--alanine ligase